MNVCSIWPFAQISDDFYYPDVWQCARYFVAALFKELVLITIREMWSLESRSRTSRSGSRLLWQCLDLRLVSKFEPGLGLGGYGLDYITATNSPNYDALLSKKLKNFVRHVSSLNQINYITRDFGTRKAISYDNFFNYFNFSALRNKTWFTLHSQKFPLCTLLQMDIQTVKITKPLPQWFPNCGTRTTSGTRRPSRWYASRPTTFCLSSQKYIHSYVFYLSGSVN